MKKFMIIETFKAEKLVDLYQQFDEQGRLLPQGVNYLDSWIAEDLSICYQLMESESLELIEEWISHWDEFADFKIVPIINSDQAKKQILKNN